MKWKLFIEGMDSLTPKNRARLSNGWHSMSSMIVVSIYLLLFFSTVLYFKVISGQVNNLVMSEADEHYENSARLIAQRVHECLNTIDNHDENISHKDIPPELIQNIGLGLNEVYGPHLGEIVIFNEDGDKLFSLSQQRFDKSLMVAEGFQHWSLNEGRNISRDNKPVDGLLPIFKTSQDDKSLTLAPAGDTGLFAGLIADRGYLLWKAKNFETGLLISMIVTYAIAIFLFMLLLRLIMSPLKMLTNAVERFGRGELSTRVRVKSNNEVGQLGKAFNAMAEDLESNYHEIESYSMKLEESNQKAKHAMEILAKRNQELAMINKLSYESGKNFNFQENIEYLVDGIDREYNPLFIEAFIIDEKTREWVCIKSSSESRDNFAMTSELNNLLYEVAEIGKTRITSGRIHPINTTSQNSCEELLIFPVQLSAGSYVLMTLGLEKRGGYSSREIEFLSNLMRHAGLILHNAQMYETSLKRSEILEKINAVGQSILSELNFKKLVPRVLRELKSIMNVSRVVLIYSDDDTDTDLRCTLDEEWMIRDFDEITEDCHCQKVAQSRMTLLEHYDGKVEDWIWDLYGEEYRSFLGIPLISGRSKGLLGLYSTEKSFFTAEDVRFATTFSNYLSSAFSNAHLFSTIKEREKSRTEQLEVAKKFQSDRIPYHYEQGKVELECALMPALELAGDFFDVFPLGTQSVGVVIGDVATKGIPASLMTFSILSLFRNAAKSLTPPNRVMQIVNQGLISQIKEQSWFATAFYARIHSDDLTMTYSKAGHVLPILYRNETKECIQLDVGGVPLGILEEGNYQTRQIKLHKDDRLILYTDGVTELRIDNHEMFGLDRLIEVIKENAEKSVAELKEAIFQSLEKTGDTRFKRDDILVAVLGVKSDPWISRKIKYSQSGDLIAEVIEQMNYHKVPKQVMYAIRLSLNETLANSHKHGNHGDDSKDILVKYVITDEMFSLSVVDDGNGFDYEALPDPTVEENLLLPHGRGIFLMRSLMDEIEFNEKGNSIMVTKYLYSDKDQDIENLESLEPALAG